MILSFLSFCLVSLRKLSIASKYCFFDQLFDFPTFATSSNSCGVGRSSESFSLPRVSIPARSNPSCTRAYSCQRGGFVFLLKKLLSTTETALLIRDNIFCHVHYLLYQLCLCKNFVLYLCILLECYLFQPL